MLIQVETRQVGAKRPLRSDWTFDPGTQDGDGGEPLTLRRLITRAVRAEVAAFRERQQGRATYRLMSETAVDEGARKGAVRPGLQHEAQEVDEEAAVGAALQAFEDGIYLVFIDNVEQRDLDQEVYLQDNSVLRFIRLVMLAGA